MSASRPAFTRRSQSLLALQDSLQRDTVERAAVPMVLPVMAGLRQLKLPMSLVSRISLPAGMAQVSGYQMLPKWVVGICASHGQLVTVLDSGVLSGQAAITQSMKTRLVVLSPGGHGLPDGLALLVSRVMDAEPAAPNVERDSEYLGASKLAALLAAAGKGKS